MAMEFFTFHYEFVANFPPDDQDDNLISFDIIQRPQVPGTKFELDKRISSHPLDGFRRRHGILLKTGEDGGLQDSLITNSQGRSCRSASSVIVILKGIATLTG
jgi:hypothetical protein